jgi:Sec-independent protein secretion pathway component TatC
MLQVIEALILSVLILFSLGLSVLMPIWAWAVYKDIKDRGQR